jgi:uncharacterized membrane protein YdbT with pleckstrin-like domain
MMTAKMTEKFLWSGRSSFLSVVTNIKGVFKLTCFFALALYFYKYMPQDIVAKGVALNRYLPNFAQRGDPVFFLLLAVFGLAYFKKIINVVWSIIKIKCSEIALSNERLKFKFGVFNKYTQQVELYRIKDLVLTEPLLWRILGLQNIRIVTSDQNVRVPFLHGMSKSAELFDLLRHNVEAARDRKGVKEVDFFRS